jgi:hypothetical protein
MFICVLCFVATFARKWRFGLRNLAIETMIRDSLGATCSECFPELIHLNCFTWIREECGRNNVAKERNMEKMLADIGVSLPANCIGRLSASHVRSI